VAIGLPYPSSYFSFFSPEIELRKRIRPVSSLPSVSPLRGWKRVRDLFFPPRVLPLSVP